MDKVRLYPILDYILNEADGDDLAAIAEALKRREERHGFGGLDVQTLAREGGKSIEAQVGGSIESIRGMIRNFAVEIIRREAPDIPDEHLSSLLEAWIPEPRRQSAQAQQGRSQSPIPRDALLTMIRQYLAWKTGSMRPDELRALVTEIDDWPEVLLEQISHCRPADTEEVSGQHDRCRDVLGADRAFSVKAFPLFQMLVSLLGELSRR